MRKFIALFLCLASSAFGWEATLSVDPQIARVGQRVKLTLTVQGSQRAPAPNKISVDGIQSSIFTGTESSFRFGTGDSYQTISHSCILVPERTGDFTIPLTYSYKGETKNLSTTLRVIQSEQGAASSVDEMFFAKMRIDEEKIYVHQPFTVRMEIYTIQGAQITDRISLSNMPEAGLDELKWTQLQPIQQVVDQRIYTVSRYQCSSHALTAGTFPFAPQVNVQAVVGRDRFFGSQTQTVPLIVDPFELKVLPLPMANKPSGFSEGVGSFDFVVENIPSEVNQGDPITVRMRINGNGNLRSIKAPTFSADPRIKTYESSRISADESSAVFEQVLMLNDPTLTELPALNFSYFDTQSETYKTITRGPFPITVNANGSAAQVLTDLSLATAHTEILGQDIMYLKPIPHQWAQLNKPRWYTHKLFLGLLPLPALLTTILGLILRQLRQLHANPTELRKRGALKAATPALKAADHAAREANCDAFYSELWRAIVLYFGDKLNLSAGEICETRLLAVLQRVDKKTVELDAFRTLLQTCEHQRYGMKPDNSTHEMQQMTGTVRAIIKHCERKLK